MMVNLALAAAMVAGTPLAAQPYYGGPRGAWNSNDFWQGAPRGVWERIDFLQRRIDRGIEDGSLDRNEARRAQWQLRRIRRDANAMRRNGFSSWESASIQRRLDDLSRSLRWMRHNDRGGYGNDRYGNGNGDHPGWGQPGYYDRYRTDYDAAHYYREGPQYQERRLTSEDEIYRGSDGRYYCKRSDGTTGLVIGAAAGALLGNIADGGHDRVAGTLIGGALGALIGRQIDRDSDLRCR